MKVVCMCNFVQLFVDKIVKSHTVNCILKNRGGSLCEGFGNSVRLFLEKIVKTHTGKLCSQIEEVICM